MASRSRSSAAIVTLPLLATLATVPYVGAANQLSIVLLLWESISAPCPRIVCAASAAGARHAQPGLGAGGGGRPRRSGGVVWQIIASRRTVLHSGAAHDTGAAAAGRRGCYP